MNEAPPPRWCHQEMWRYDVILIDFPYSHRDAVKGSKNKSHLLKRNGATLPRVNGLVDTDAY